MGTQLSRMQVIDARGISQDQWLILKEQASMFIKSGFLPQAIKTPEQAISIILKGRELGVPPLQALSSISVIQGKPVCSSELMAALIYRDQGDDALIIEKSTNTGCAILYKRAGWKEPRQYIFTIEDAQRAQIADKDSWKKYPAAMLRARAISAVARFAFPDSLAGMYTPEEMGVTDMSSDPDMKIDKGTGEVLEGERTESMASAPTASAPSPTTEQPSLLPGGPQVSDRPSPSLVNGTLNVGVNEDGTLRKTSPSDHLLLIEAHRMGLGWKDADLRNCAIKLFGAKPMFKTFMHGTEWLAHLTDDQLEQLQEELDALLATAKSPVKA